MNSFLKNPLSLWFMKLVKAKLCILKHRKKHLTFGYLSYANNSKFGIFNKIKDNVTITNSEINDFTYVSNNTKIQYSTIGKFCSIGPNVQIGLGKHPTKDFVSTHPIFFSDLANEKIQLSNTVYFKEFENIVIGHDVWIGANAIVLDGVTINDGAIIAAGAIVTKDVPHYAIVGGIPAKIIKFRFEESEIKDLKNLKWWDMDFNYLKKHFVEFHNIKKLLEDYSMPKETIRKF